jgi:hypothetical protein
MPAPKRAVNRAVMPGAHESWEMAAAALLIDIDGPTQAQRELADQLADQPGPVAAATLRRATAEALRLEVGRPATEGAMRYAMDLATATGTAIPDDHVRSEDYLNAWITVMHAKRARSALQDLMPTRGDLVRVVTPTRFGDQPEFGEISSISSDGRLNFRGGNGRGARPHEVVLAARRDDDDAANVRERARNEVARRDPRARLLGLSGRRELESFKATTVVTSLAVAALTDALQSADSERPLQKVIEDFPELLASLVNGNHGSWVIPQASLGAHFKPDFLVAWETSLGIQWLLVELESPTHTMLTQKGRLASGPRQGVAQIQDWRRWLSENVGMARRPRDEMGLGLPGIAAKSLGLVLVGRAAIVGTPDYARQDVASDSDIAVRSWDWLLSATAVPRRLGHGVLGIELGLDRDDDDWPA